MTESSEFNLWHYTNAEGLKGILENKTLWATDYRYLNDSLEFTYSKEILRQLLLPEITNIIEDMCTNNSNARKIAESCGGIHKTAESEIQMTLDILYGAMLNPPAGSPQKIFFVLSFCKHDINSQFLQNNGLLSQWRGYGKDGGYAIVFEEKELRGKYDTERQSFYYGLTCDDKVTYIEHDLDGLNSMRQHVDTVVHWAKAVYKDRTNGMKKPPEVTSNQIEALLQCMAFIKHFGFEEEKEYRISVMPYTKEWLSNPDFNKENKEHKLSKEIKVRNRNGTLVPYIELFKSKDNLPIKAICVGPHPDKEARAKSLRAYLDTMELNNIEIFCSYTPYIGSS